MCLVNAVAVKELVRGLRIPLWVFLIAVLVFSVPIAVARCPVGVAFARIRVTVSVSL